MSGRTTRPIPLPHATPAVNDEEPPVLAPGNIFVQEPAVYSLQKTQPSGSNRTHQPADLLHLQGPFFGGGGGGGGGARAYLADGAWTTKAGGQPAALQRFLQAVGR